MPSKYKTFEPRDLTPRDTIHPIWRGIGFLMIVITPIMAGAGAMVLLDLARQQGWPIMRELGGYLKFPEIFYQTPGISSLAYRISAIPALPAIITFFLGLLLVFSGVLSFIYAVIYRLIGPPRYTPLDAPAPKVRTKRYTR